MLLETAIKKDDYRRLHPMIRKLFSDNICSLNASNKQVEINVPLVIVIGNQAHIVEEVFVSDNGEILKAEYSYQDSDENRDGDIEGFIVTTSINLLTRHDYTLHPLYQNTGITNDHN